MRLPTNLWSVTAKKEFPIPEQDTNSWRQALENAIKQNVARADSRFFQLATMDHQQRPACRTVVFRGFTDNSNSLIAHTDKRSEKIPQLNKHPHAEICWYFSDSREQFRLSSKITVITLEQEHAQKLRLSHWQALSPAAKVSYTCATPGSALVTEQSQKTKAAEVSALTAMPSENFALLLIFPFKVDHLLLRPSPQQRTLYKQQEDGSWQTNKVNA